MAIDDMLIFEDKGDWKVGNIFVVADTHGSKIEFASNPEDILIHCGDWESGEINTAAKKILVLGNHDILPPVPFDFVCSGILLNNVWFTHEPAFTMPLGGHYNVHGHTHDIDLNDLGYVRKPWHITLIPNEIKTLERIIWEHKEGKV